MDVHLLSPVLHKDAKRAQSPVNSGIHGKEVGVIDAHNIVDIQVALHTRELIAELKNGNFGSNEIAIFDET